jgi:flagellar basal body P-ring protein FlgI
MSLTTRRRTLGLLSTASLAAAVAVGPGCTEAAPKTKPTYASLPKRDVPAFMADSVYQYTDMTGTEPFPISGYGLVANLRGTGGCRAPTAVRDYMIKELARHHFGSLDTGWETPDKILDSKDFSIVRVEGYLPPGARAGSDWSTWFDVRLAALPESDATSLAHGDLYECDLKVGGANPLDPGNGMVSVKAQATGAVFVNPTYVADTDTDTDTPAARASRRTGYVLAGARVMEDRPLILRLRAPEQRMARAIERRIIERFQDVVDDDLQAHGNTAAKKVANAQDEATIYVYVPRCYADHWDHFAGIVKHLYVQGDDPAFAALRARQLADAAVLPDAKLLDISYAWEGLGKPALFALTPLMTDPRADVRFAAARAAAFIGDPAAVPVLADIATTVGDPFRVNAVETLGELPATPRINAAYQLLCRNGDPSIYTRWVKDGDKEIFALDIVRGGHAYGGHAGSGRPLVYATQQGVPRVAVFGTDTAIDLPMIFSTLEDNRLMISTSPEGDALTVSYRSPYRKDLVGFTCGPDLPELVAHLGGDGDTSDSASKLHLGYSDVVAVLQALVDGRKVSGTSGLGGERLAASFVLGEPSIAIKLPVADTSRLLRSATGGRPTSDNPADKGNDAPVDDGLLRHPAAPVAPATARPMTESEAAAAALANR